jgi:photosystem II stability/assembly factor-like uncharacterized protein
MRFSFSFLLIFFTLFNQAYPQWYWEHPVPQGNHLSELSFNGSSSIGFAVGDYGVILRSDNSGENWELMDSVTTENLTSVFRTENRAYIVGDNGIMLKSDDLESWYQTESFTHYKLYSVFFGDDDHGYAVGYQGTILKTNSGGEFWQYILSGTPFTLYSVHFANPDIGIIVGDSGTILRTTDAGLNWSQTGTSTNPLFDVFFPSDSIGYIAGKDGLILRSNDSGINWTDVSSPFIKTDLYSVHFYNDTIGYIAGSNGIVIHTYDGGGLWQLDTTLTTLSFQSVHQFYHDTTSDTVIICGEFGVIQKKNTLSNFVNISGGSHETFGSVIFLPDSSGIAIGGYPFNDECTLYRTTKPGGPWTEIFFDSLPCYPTDISFPTDSLGYISSKNGRVYKSTDAGNSWNRIKTDVISDLYAVCFPDSAHGFAAGMDGLLIKTTTIDTLWNLVETGTTNSLFALHFFDKQNGYAVGENGTVLRVKNSGSNISSVNSGTSASLYDIFFPTDTLGFICGYDGKIFKIKPYFGSDSLFPVNSGVTVPLNKIWFPNPDTGYIAGEVGTILKTTDGGNTWYPQYTGTSNSFRGIYFFNGNKGVVVGAGLTVLSTENGGGSVILPGIPDLSPADQNITLYPNPATRIVTLEFLTAPFASAEIEIIDLTGKLMKTLQSAVNSGRRHKISVDLSELDPGIYLLMVETASTRITKKLVITSR